MNKVTKRTLSLNLDYTLLIHIKRVTEKKRERGTERGRIFFRKNIEIKIQIIIFKEVDLK